MWLLNAFSIILSKRRFIVLNTVVVTILAAIISFVLPKTYIAKATILPPESSTPFSGLIGLSTGQIAQAVTNFSLPLMATPSDLYASMLESETVLMGVVDSLRLREVYDSRDNWSAVSELREKVKIRVEAEGIIVVEAEARTNKLAADIANTMVEKLDEFNQRIQNQKGREYSGFLERRLAESDSALKVASNELKSFQEVHRAVSLELQSEALIENLAKQKALLTITEVELEILKKTLYPNHPELTRKEMMVRGIRNKLFELEQGATSRADSTLSALDIPLSRIPDLSLQFAVLKRNAKIQELTFELLSQQLEMARIQERRDTPTVIVLDSAHPSDTPSKPRKKLIVVTAFVLSLGLSMLIAVAIETMAQREQRPESLRFLSEAVREIKKNPLG